MVLHLQHLQCFEAYKVAPQVLSKFLFSIRNTNDPENATSNFQDQDQTPDQTKTRTKNHPQEHLRGRTY
jgi:hypothetical protein